MSSISMTWPLDVWCTALFGYAALYGLCGASIIESGENTNLLQVINNGSYVTFTFNNSGSTNTHNLVTWETFLLQSSGGGGGTLPGGGSGPTGGSDPFKPGGDPFGSGGTRDVTDPFNDPLESQLPGRLP